MPTPTERERMTQQQIAGRGVRDEQVLDAFREVPREAFVPEHLQEFAYKDAPLPIEEGQTISQPFIVARMTELLELDGDERVLEVGTGSGYAAAILSRIAQDVFTIERHGRLAETARERFERLGYDNVHVRHGDGTLGWPEHAPYDAIVAAASGPDVPQPLLDQLAVGGVLVLPVGQDPSTQRLVRVRRTSESDYERENLTAVRFVPLVGKAGWEEPGGDGAAEREPAPPEPQSAPEIVKAGAEPFDKLDTADLGPLLDRIGDAKVVCIGEASHGTSEFYRMRARITRKLIEEQGFSIVAAEADWPDAARIDQHVRQAPAATSAAKPFSRFPTWMWANEEVLQFVDWLREHNEQYDDPEDATGFYGLDLYSLFSSIGAVLEYLDDVDPEAADVARHRYGCLSPYESDPATYGAAALKGRYGDCEEDVIAMLHDLMEKRMDYAAQDGQRFFDAVQNARLVAGAEAYYRSMYYGRSSSWNLRDRHMFETLQALLDHRDGGDARAVVWAHNSHLGDASATEMGARGQLNVGQLCREEYGDDAYLIGFGTHTGTVAAASGWGRPMEVKKVRPSHSKSYEGLCHETGVPNFLLPLREPNHRHVRDVLRKERLERAIGVIYRPETELQSHYFHAELPRQFDEYIWLEETSAVTPLTTEHAEGAPDTFPFAL